MIPEPRAITKVLCSLSGDRRQEERTSVLNSYAYLDCGTPEVVNSKVQQN